MKKIFIFTIAFAISLSINAQRYDILWKEFDNNIENLLPGSANKTLDKIEKQAKKDKNDIQLLKMVIKRCEVFCMTDEHPDTTIVAYCKSYMPKLSEPSQVILNCEIAKHFMLFDDIREYKDNDFIKTVSMKKYVDFFQNKTEKTDYDIDIEPTLYDYAMHCNLAHVPSMDLESELYEKLLNFDLENNYIKAYYNNRICQLGDIHNEEVFKTHSQLATECTDNELVAKIRVKQIEYLIDKKEYDKAKNLCEETMAMLDKNDTLYKQCVDVINSITKKSVKIRLFNVYVPDQAIAVGLKYRNTTNPSYKIYRLSADEFLEIAHLDDEKTYKTLLVKKPVVENNLEIPEETDYKEHSSLIALPALQNGQYYIVFSNNNSFKNYDDLIYSAFQVSNLSYFNVKSDEGTNIYIVNRETGAPMKDVVAHFSERKYSYKSKSYERNVIGDVTSNKDGFLTVPYSDMNSCYVDLYSNNDTLVSNSLFYLYQYFDADDVVTNAEIFTDRAIYRPGQTVQFSCVVYQGNSKNKEVLPNYETVIEFRDPNYQIIDTQHIITDEFGSASGSFSIPTDRINGEYKLVWNNHRTFIKVEEYKRPTFEVTFNTPELIYKVGDSVTISGKVAALSGFGLDNVKYRYTVTRKTTFPCRFWNWTPSALQDKTIETGEGVTFVDGAFIFDFQLTPSSIDITKIPRYTYEVTVEATNKQGETQSGTFTVSVTYNQYVLGLSNTNSTIEAKDFKNLDVTATNINGIPVKTNVECKIFKINDIYRFEKDLGNFDRQLLSDHELNELFPNFDYYYTKNITKDIVYQEIINVDGKARLLPTNIDLQPAKYVVELRSMDDTLSAYSTSYVVFNLQSKKMPVKSMCWTYIDKNEAQPGETINYYVGSSEQDASALVVVKRGKTTVKTERISLNNSIYKFSYTVAEEDRGRLDFQTVLVKYNTNIWPFIRQVSIPYNNLDLDIILHTERDKILPSETDTWSLTVKDYKGKPVETSMVATMYDAALDDLHQLNWYLDIVPKQYYGGTIEYDRSFSTHNASQFYFISIIKYDEKPIFSNTSLIPYHFRNRNQYYLEKASANGVYAFEDEIIEEGVFMSLDGSAYQQNQSSCSVKPAKIRKDFNETAFFFPNLRTDENGDCTFTFTMPDALTRWNFRILAYSKDLKVGTFEKTIVTQQPLMIMADMPRFAYDDDTLWIAANVINLSEKALSPSAKLEIFDENNNPIELILSEQNINISEIPAGRSQSVRWKVAMKKDVNLLTFRFSAITDGFSDAEQHQMPVLSTEVYLTQTYALTAKAHSVKEYDFDIDHEGERNQKITLNFNENPLWTAIHAMPYVAEGDEKYAMTAFYRYFVNSMAKQIMESHPEIAEKLKNTYKNDTLSELQKYEDLKAIILQETPWVLEAQHEASQRAAIAKLFDTEEVDNNIKSAHDLLASKQTPNGGWSWIDGCPESVLITQYILTGLGKLGTNDELTEKAFHFIENEVIEDYDKFDTKKHCSWTTMRSLYAMSYFNYKTSWKFDTAKRFFVKKLKKDWKRFGLEERAYIALILNRNGEKKTAKKIVQSLREYSAKGVRILEAFNEIDPHIDEIDAQRVWILTQKRTNMWENERASVEAIFALVNTGSEWTDDGNVTITAADDYTHAVIDNQSDHEAWGGLYRQYFVPIDKVQKHNDAMKIKRELVMPENVKVGDKIKVEITFENSQDMEFVYLKDLRGACFEPKEQLSEYHWNDGLWYYQSTSDVAMEFFFEQLPKGKHTVSYEVYVTKEGSFSAGYSLIQCQYAPEFGAYSNGERIEIGEE